MFRCVFRLALSVTSSFLHIKPLPCLVHHVVLIFNSYFLSLLPISYLTQLLRARMWLLGSPRVHVFEMQYKNACMSYF